MISHDKALSLVSARYDEPLSPAETRALHEHLATCASCRQFAAETDLLVNGLRSLPQLPASARVSQGVREGIRGGASPWGWLGQGLRIATSPTLAVASSLVLVAALAFIVILALQPLGTDEQPRATISAMAIDDESTRTPTAVPQEAPTEAPTEETSFLAPTAEPTEEPTVAPTAEPTVTPASTRTNVAAPTPTPAPTEPAPVATEQSITSRGPRATEPPAETPVPTEAPVDSAREVTQEQQAATEAPTMEPEAEPTSPPTQSGEAGAPFTSTEEPDVAAGSEQPPAVAQPTIAQGGPPDDAGVVAADANSEQDTVGTEDAAGAEGEAADAAETEPTAAPEPETAEPTTEPAAPTAAPEEQAPAETPPASTEIQPSTADSEMPVLPDREGNEAESMDGETLAAEISATVMAGLEEDDGVPTVPASTVPPVQAMPTEGAPAEPTPAAGTGGDGGNQGPVGAEITGAPATEELNPEGEAENFEANSGVAADTAPIEATGGEQVPAEQAPVEQAPVEQAPAAAAPVGAPDPGWPGIGAAGTQYVSAAGYSAISDGAGVSVYGPDGTALGVVGGGIPVWSPSGTSLLVIGPDGLGQVWDVVAGPMPVERPSAPARDIPAGWLGAPVVQRVYLDGSGLVELRVVPVDGSAGYPLGTATADSVFGEGVTAARLSPDGGQVSFVSGGQLYIAPSGDPASAAPAG